MVVVCSADNNGVYFANFSTEQFAVVVVEAGLRKPLLCPIKVSVIDVTNRHDRLVGHIIHIVATTIGRADAGDLEFIVGGQRLSWCQTAPDSCGQSSATGCEGLQNLSS